MKRLAFAIIGAALLWSGWWLFAATQLRTATENWFADRRAQGWEASYSALTVRGFPNRLDRSFRDLVLADPATGIVWEAPFFQLFQLSYRPSHVIAVWPEQHSLTTRHGRWQISDQGLRASLVLDSDKIARLNVEADTLNLQQEAGRAVALADLRAAFLRQDGVQDAYRIAMTAGGLARDTASTTGLPDSMTGLQVDMTATFDTSWTVNTLHSPRPQPVAMDIRLAEYSYGDLLLKLAGDLQISPRGLPAGDLTVQARNWRVLLDKAKAAGHLPASIASLLGDGLGLLAGLRGNPETLDLPLGFSGGRMSLGPVPLGPAPIIRLP